MLVQRVVHPTFLQAEHTHAWRVGLGHVVHRHIHTLEHGGQHGAGVQVVLVAVHANGQFARVFGGLIHAHTGATGGGKHHVHAPVELGFGQLTAPGWVVPGRTGGAGHVGDHLCFGIGGFGTLLVSTLEFSDQRYVHAPHKTNLAGFAGLGRHHTHEVAALLLLEDDRLHVGQVDHHVDDGELELGKLFRHFFDAGSLPETDANDGTGAALSHAPDGLLALGFVGNFKVEVLATRFFFPALHAFVSGLVERFVELASHVKHDGRLGMGVQGSSTQGGNGAQFESGKQGHGSGLQVKRMHTTGDQGAGKPN